MTNVNDRHACHFLRPKAGNGRPPIGLERMLRIHFIQHAPLAGLLRQYFPEPSNFLKASQDEVNDAVYRLNHRPRKCLDDRTPHEVFFHLKMSPLKLSDDALFSCICVLIFYCGRDRIS
jgi:hypothetical protein